MAKLVIPDRATSAKVDGLTWVRTDDGTWDGPGRGDSGPFPPAGWEFIEWCTGPGTVFGHSRAKPEQPFWRHPVVPPIAAALLTQLGNWLYGWLT